MQMGGVSGVPVQAPQPVVLGHVTAAMMGATPQQVMVAIMKYRKFRSMLACTTAFAFFVMHYLSGQPFFTNP